MSDAKSDIIYGFNLSTEIDGIDYERAWAWEKHIIADLVAPESYSVDHKLRTPEQAVEVAAWFAAKRQRIADSASIVAWGYLDEPHYVIGVCLVHGDWDQPKIVEASDVLRAASDMDARVAELCAWLGIEPQPCKLLLLSSYG